jgi:hypothetical protein
MTGRRAALIVANDRYDHEGLRQLVSPVPVAPVAVAEVPPPPPVPTTTYVDYGLIAAGVVSVILGAILLGSGTDDEAVRIAEIHLVVFAAVWAAAAVTARGARRILPAVLAAGAVASLLWMIVNDWYYLKEYAFRGTPMAWFWLVAGLGAVAATLGPRRPWTTMDQVSGAATVLFGIMVLVVISRGSDSALATCYAFFVMVLGLLWAGAGLERRLAP